MARRILTSSEISDALDLPTDSEDGLDLSDTDSEGDATFLQDADSGDEDNLLIDLNSSPNVNNTINSNAPAVQTTQSPQSSTSSNNQSKKAKMIWKRKNLSIPDGQTSFNGNQSLVAEIMSLDTPFKFFQYFFTNELIDIIAEQTKLYSVQLDPSKPFDINSDDIKKYLGICVFMSLIHVPNSRCYWSEMLGHQRIKDTMPVNMFEKIRKYLHFNDNDSRVPNTDLNHDKLHKIRPIIDELKKKFLSVRMEECLSLDQQMCATKARHLMKQYMQMKPHNWGYKIFVLSGVSGFVYDFEIYSGQENDPNRRLTDEPDLGATGNIVIRLSRQIPRNVNHKLYFDNFYTSIPLMVYLAKNGILTLGTVRRNRIPDCKLLTDAELKTKSRGTSEEFVGSVDGIDISSVVWKDNKTVILLSTFAGELPKQSVQRFDRKQKKTISVDCPNLITKYNKHMGGVELLDSILDRYKIKMRSKKWYFRLFYHFLDMTIVNAWLLYRRVKESDLPLYQFRTEIADCLCRTGQVLSSKRGRPSTELELQIEAKKKRGPTAHIPPKDVRQDRISHLPEWMDKRQRCKLPFCNGFTFVRCTKCAVSLCLNKNKNCFINFHTK